MKEKIKQSIIVGLHYLKVASIFALILIACGSIIYARSIQYITDKEKAIMQTQLEELKSQKLSQ